MVFHESRLTAASAYAANGNMLLIDNILVVDLFLARIASHVSTSSRTRQNHRSQRLALARLDALQMALVLLLWAIASMLLLIDLTRVYALDKAIR